MATTQVFTGAGIPYAAFNLRDPYYFEMARFVVNAAKARLGVDKISRAVDLGAGIGISTMEILKDVSQELVAVEPDDSMRYLCELNTMGDPRVRVLKGSAQQFPDALYSQHDIVTHVITEPRPVYDAIMCCQMFHLLNPPGRESLIPVALKMISSFLRRGGVFAFDLGPSNFEFKAQLADHRGGVLREGDIVTELAHPLYDYAHRLLKDVIEENLGLVMKNQSLWPPAGARMSIKYLQEVCKDAGFKTLQVREEFSPVSGERVVNFIRNGWSVFFRWGKLSDLPTEKKLELMNEVLRRLFQSSGFEALKTLMSYHPTAVFTAVKG